MASHEAKARNLCFLTTIVIYIHCYKIGQAFTHVLTFRHVMGFGLIVRSAMPLSFVLDDFPESTGVKRIVQALNANVWSNVVMKSGM